MLTISRANLFGFGLPPAETSAVQVLEGLLSLAPPTSFSNFDVVFDQGSAGGAGIDSENQLWVIHGETVRAVQQAVATAGGTITTQQPNADLLTRIANARNGADPEVVNATFGKVSDVRVAVENLIDRLKSGQSVPVAPSPLPVMPGVAATKFTPGVKIAIGAATAVAAAGILTAVVLAGRR